jgi:hypothetical protein
VVDKPNFFANPAIVSDLKIPWEMNPDTATNDDSSPDIRSKYSQ